MDPQRQSSYILTLLPGALLLCILAARAADNYRRRHPIIYGLLAFAGGAYGAYATLLSGDPIDALRAYIRPDEGQVVAVMLGLAVHSLWNRAADESRSESAY